MTQGRPLSITDVDSGSHPSRGTAQDNGGPGGCMGYYIASLLFMSHDSGS